MVKTIITGKQFRSVPAFSDALDNIVRGHGGVLYDQFNLISRSEPVAVKLYEIPGDGVVTTQVARSRSAKFDTPDGSTLEYTAVIQLAGFPEPSEDAQRLYAAIEDVVRKHDAGF